MKGIKLLGLFDNPTVSQITISLIAYKELSASQLSKLTKKNISTISRQLTRMENENYIYLSKTELINNLQIKYWKLNSDIFQDDPKIDTEELSKLPQDERNLIISQLQNTLYAFRGIMKSIFDSNISEVVEVLEGKKGDFSQDSYLNILLLRKSKGEKMLEELGRFLENFDFGKEEDLTLDHLDLDSYLIFFLASPFRYVVPRFEDS